MGLAVGWHKIPILTSVGGYRCTVPWLILKQAPRLLLVEESGITVGYYGGSLWHRSQNVPGFQIQCSVRPIIFGK